MTGPGCLCWQNEPAQADPGPGLVSALPGSGPCLFCVQAHASCCGTAGGLPGSCWVYTHEEGVAKDPAVLAALARLLCPLPLSSRQKALWPMLGARRPPGKASIARQCTAMKRHTPEQK